VLAPIVGNLIGNGLDELSELKLACNAEAAPAGKPIDVNAVKLCVPSANPLVNEFIFKLSFLQMIVTDKVAIIL
jgi:hypothetical protein